MNVDNETVMERFVRLVKLARRMSRDLVVAEYVDPSVAREDASYLASVEAHREDGHQDGRYS